MINLDEQEIEIVSGGVDVPGYPSTDWKDPLEVPNKPGIFIIN